MAIIDRLTAATRRTTVDKVQNLLSIDERADHFTLMMIANAKVKFGALGLGKEIGHRTKQQKAQWYRGFVRTDKVEQPQQFGTGRVPWYWLRMPFALDESELRQNTGLSIWDLLDTELDDLSSIANEDQVLQLFSILEETALGAQEDIFDAIGYALWNGGIGNHIPANQTALAMDGLNTIFDRTEKYAGIDPGEYGEFPAGDPWVSLIDDGELGQSSKNLWEPRTFREGAALTTISFDLLNPIIQTTHRFTNGRICGLHPLLYSTLENSVRSLHQLQPDGMAKNFGIESFKIGDTTFVKSLRAPTDRARIVPKRLCYLEFGLTRGERARRVINKAGSVFLPVRFGRFIKATSEAVENALYADVHLVCEARAAMVEVLRLQK